MDDYNAVDFACSIFDFFSFVLIIYVFVEASLYMVSVYSLFVAAHALLEQTLAKTKPSASDHSSGMTPRSIITKDQSINVLVTSGSLVPSLAKCLLYQLDDVISANNGMCFPLSLIIYCCLLFFYLLVTGKCHHLVVYMNFGTFCL